MAYDVSRRRAVVCGGAVAGEFSEETWEFDGRRWELVAPSGGPGLRAYPLMVYDSAHERVLLYGGFDPAGPKNDLWSWDGRAWTELDPGG